MRGTVQPGGLGGLGNFGGAPAKSALKGAESSAGQKAKDARVSFHDKDEIKEHRRQSNYRMRMSAGSAIQEISDEE